MSGLKNWYAGLNQREQQMVTILGIALGLLLLMLVVVMPLKKYHANLVADRDAISSQLSSLKQQVGSLQGTSNTATTGRLNQLVNTSARSYGLKFSSIQERKRDQEIQLRLDDVKFDQLIRWVADLEQKNGLIIENLRVSNTDATGIVDVSLKVLKAG